MIFLGTRSSPLAIIQARRVEAALKTAQKTKNVEIVSMKTQGDQLQIPLANFGGKQLFTKELQDGLLSGFIHGAVHSLKDVEEHSLDLIFSAFLERQNPLDVMIVHQDYKDVNVDSEFRIGTCSPRRKQQIQKIYLKAAVLDIRGNVGTRLSKVSSQMFDSIILAKAGLERLNIYSEEDLISLYPNLRMRELPAAIMVPAAGQGIIVVECIPQNKSLFACINDPVIEKVALTERMFIKAFNGNCRTALAAYVYPHADSCDYKIDGFYQNQWQSIDLKDFLHRDLGSLREDVEKFVGSFER